MSTQPDKSGTHQDQFNENQELVSQYLNMLASQRKLAELTVLAYRRDLDELCVMVGALALTALTESQIRRYVTKLHAGGLDARSIARTLSAWRGLFDWLVETQKIKASPAVGVKAPKRGKPLPKALSADDAVKLVSEKSILRKPDLFTERCNRAMFELLYSSGLRVSELVGLDVRFTHLDGYQSQGWIDLAAGEVTVTGKGSKLRTVPIGKPAVLALQDWLAIRNEHLVPVDIDDASALFWTSNRTRISPRLVQLRIKAHANAIGIASDVHPHVMRHSFATHILQSSGDLRAVQELLGHASITSTQVYTALDFQHLSKVYDAAHPRAKKK